MDDDDVCMSDEIRQFSTDVFPLIQGVKHVMTSLAVAGVYIGLHMDQRGALPFFLG